jgi:hypothetical protein
VNLRNCVAHGVVLNDVFSINDVATRFDLNYIVAALTELMVALKEDAPFGFLDLLKAGSKIC